MTTEHWDAIVVGSGPGGLTAAACLAGAGRRVLVLEQHDVAGGNTQVFRRQRDGNRYEFDVGVHYVGECGPGGLLSQVFDGLGIGERLEFRPLDPERIDTLVFPDMTFEVPTGWDEYTRRLVDRFPGEREGIEDCIGVLRRVAEESRRIFGEERPTYDEWAYRPLSELYESCELPARVVAVMNHWSVLYAGSPSDTAVAMAATITGHYMSGAFYPAGGGQMIAARLVQAIEACDGEVRTLSPVERIRIDDGTVRGVELADGSFVAAPVVVSNADHRRTIERLVGTDKVAATTAKWADDATMALGLICVYVVVDRVLEGTNTNYFVFPDRDPDAAYALLERGDLPDAPLAYIALTSRKDPGNPGLCPPGHTNFQIMTLAPRGLDFWGVETGPADGGRYRRNPVYRERKAAITDALIDTAEKVLGPFRDAIVHLETATTLSHERYTRSTGGTSYGYQHSPAQFGVRRPRYRTEIDGLWLVGANTVSGHGIAGAIAGGVFCAGEILDRPLIVEFFLGQHLIDPATIPPDPDDFDPLELSRGARLRQRRADQRSAQQQRRLAGLDLADAPEAVVGEGVGGGRVGGDEQTA